MGSVGDEGSGEAELSHTELLRDSPGHCSVYPYPGAGISLGPR